MNIQDNEKVKLIHNNLDGLVDFFLLERADNIGYIKEITCSVDDSIDKENLQQILDYWSQYGWGVIRFFSLNMYQTQPKSFEEADNIAMQFFSENNIQYFLNAMEGNIKSNEIFIEDFIEARYCFTAGKFKACALILFALIDSRLIKLQPMISNCRQRSTGEKAAQRIKDILDKEPQNQNKVYAYTEFSTLIEIIKLFYKNSNNFQIKDNILNRNLIAHGMLKRKVTKIDCLKLFVILDNLITFIDFFNMNELSE